MFDILVYLYETYYRPDACPDAAALAKKLSAVGFEEDEISEALDWLTVLADTTSELINQPQQDAQDAQAARASKGFRVYAGQEISALGITAMGFIQYLESAGLLNSQQREIVIERAMAINEVPVPLDKLKVIVLMMLWSQGKEPDMLMFDELLLSDEESAPRLLH
jgi:Smg protein